MNTAMITSVVFDNVLVGALALALLMGCGVAVTLIPPLWNAWVEQEPARVRHVAKRGWRGFISDEVGGYVHDTQVSFFVPPQLHNAVTGTWADAAGVVSNTYAKKASLGNNTATVTIPLYPLGNGAAQKGFYLRTIDIWWEVETAAVDALAATIYLATLPANGAAFSAPASQSFTYDTGHDGASERLTADQHKMTLTLATPIWLDDDSLVTVELAIDGAANSVVYLHGARANGTLRL